MANFFISFSSCKIGLCRTARKYELQAVFERWENPGRRRICGKRRAAFKKTASLTYGRVPRLLLLSPPLIVGEIGSASNAWGSDIIVGVRRKKTANPLPFKNRPMVFTGRSEPDRDSIRELQ